VTTKLSIVRRYSRVDIYATQDSADLQDRDKRQKPGRLAAGKKLAYLSWYLARRERFDDEELGLQRLAVRSLLASFDEVEMDRIALKSRVRLEAPRSQALFSSQYLCRSSQPDTSHVIHEISIQNV
jgi:hypothetical protein